MSASIENIVFASDCPECPSGCGEPYCDEHGQHYADCPCVGPDEQPQTLFDVAARPEWKDEWRGMPEFIQERKREYAKLIIRFRNQEDLEEFARVIGQKLNRKSQCTWYPEFEKSESRHAGKVYVAES